MHIASIIVLLFVVASAVALLAGRLRLPYTVALVITGLVLGQLHVLETPHLTQELLFAVFLPGLLFEAAFHLEYKVFRRNQSVILGLAVPGVLASILLTAAILVPAAAVLPLHTTLTWGHALVFGALVAATDPIAVVALFRSLGAPPRLTALLEGESLLNDGTSIVFFRLTLGLVTGAALTISGVVLEFVQVVGIGAGVGFVIGLVVSTVIQRIDDPMIEITLTTIAAYGSFVAGEQLHGSGVIATVVAGMLCGNYGAHTGMSATTRVAVETFWQYVAFALNSIIFLLIGFEVHVMDMLASWPVILSAFVAVLVGRAAVVWIVTAVAARGANAIPRAWSAILSWGGLRGGLSMVLALSLPLDFPNRAQLIAITFGVVLLSILVQGLTMGPLIRRLGVARSGKTRAAYDRSRGELMAVQAGLQELERMMGAGRSDRTTFDELRAEYEQRLGVLTERLRVLRSEHTGFQGEELRQARRHLLMIEKSRTIEAEHEGLLGREAYEKLLADLDARLLKLEEDHSA